MLSHEEVVRFSVIFLVEFDPSHFQVICETLSLNLIHFMLFVDIFIALLL